MKKTQKTRARKCSFSLAKGNYVVYPAHGVGEVLGIDERVFAGESLRVVSIRFANERMVLRVPMENVEKSGLRMLASREQLNTAFSTLMGKVRVRRTMWSRRAQEYEAKINSGDPVSIAEVVRDLHRSAEQPDPSYSERQLYQAALERLAREVAAVESTDTDIAERKLQKILAKAA